MHPSHSLSFTVQQQYDILQLFLIKLKVPYSPITITTKLFQNPAIFPEFRITWYQDKSDNNHSHNVLTPSRPQGTLGSFWYFPTINAFLITNAQSFLLWFSEADHGAFYQFLCLLQSCTHEHTVYTLRDMNFRLNTANWTKLGITRQYLFSQSVTGLVN